MGRTLILLTLVSSKSDLAEGKVINDQIISSKTVSNNEWREVEIDLTAFAGKRITLEVENFPNDWRNEWAYWHEVKIESGK